MLHGRSPRVPTQHSLATGIQGKMQEMQSVCSAVIRPNLNVTAQDRLILPLFVNPNAIRHIFFFFLPDRNHPSPSELQS